MFDYLTDLSYQRTKAQAFGFYLAFLFLGLIFCGIGGGIGGVIADAKNFDEGFQVGTKVGSIVAIFYCLAISNLLLVRKKLFKNFGFLFLMLLSGLLATLGGAIFGMIIPAILTTKAPLSTEN